MSQIDVPASDSMRTVANDLRVALRQYARHRGFAVTVVCTLAVTIGATTAVFSIVNAVLVRALPFKSPEQLVWVVSVRPDNPAAPFSLPEFMDYRGRTRALSGLAAYGYWSASLAGDGVTEQLQGARMSGNAFDVLGIAPAAGRLLNERDDRADAPQVVVLSYRLWLRKYAGSPDILGSSVRINSQPFVIVGVLPAHFPLPLRDIDVVTALVPDRDPLRHVRGSVNFLRLFGRLNPGNDDRQADAELTAICRSLRQQFPVEYARKEAVATVPLHEALVAGFRWSMLALLGAVTLVLATALANVVSLALVRANGRRAELTMRVALGASRRRLVRQLAVEACLLAVSGAVLGWIVGLQALAAATALAPPSIPRLDEVSVDPAVMALLIGIAALATALLTVPPLAAATRTRARDSLGPGRGTIGDRWNRRVRNVMVVAEIAAALVLMLATLVLVQNLLRLRSLHPGFNPHGVFQARISIPPTYRSPEDISRFYEQLHDRLAASPGVEHVGVISVAPLSGLLYTVPFSVAGQPTGDRERSSANIRAISPDYFPAIQTRLLQGRLFTERDRPGSPPVATVSSALADRFFSGNAVGQRLLIDDNNDGPRPVEIVGVVENVRQAALDAPPALDVYIPLRQVHRDGAGPLRNNQFWMLRLRTDGDPDAFRSTFLGHLRAVDPDAAVSTTGPMRGFIDAWLGPRRFNLGLFGAFASTTVLLAVMGLYGLVSYTVSQRAQEIGLRMAIGASQRDVQRMILRQAAALGAVGAGAGVVIAAASRPLLSRMAFAELGRATDLSVNNAAASAIVAVLMAIVLLAAWLPARRASRIEPTLALRANGT